MTGSRRIPADPELVRVGQDGPTLLGSRCPACAREFFPRRWVCPVDFTDLIDVDLPRQGHLHVWTYIETPSYGRAQMDATGYGVGQVDLPGGVRVQSVLMGVPGDWAEGQLVELDVETIAHDDDGNELVVTRFRPASQAEVTTP